MRLYEFTSTSPDEPVTQQDLDSLEKYLDALYNRDDIDLEFTRHFLDRVNDQRNRKQITTGELFKMFGKAEQKYGKQIADMGDKAQAVINDVGSKLNSPFVLNWNPRRKMFELIAKTVMRKPNFMTSNPKLTV
jgi:hypothetical protein